MAVFGLIIGVFFALFAAAAGSMGAGQTPLWVGGLGIAAIVIFPILYAVIGFIYGAILAVLYNVAANVVGGIDLDIQ
jgi:hypothetical protein